MSDTTIDGRAVTGQAAIPVYVVNTSVPTSLGAEPTIDVGKVDQGTAGTDAWATKQADGANVTQGAKADAAQTDQTQTASLVSIAKGIVATLKTLVVLGAGTNLIGKVGIDQVTAGANVIAGTTISIGDETTRVSDGNAYAIGDAISATVSDTGTTPLRSLALARVAGGSGYITKIRLMTDQVGCVAQIKVHFYTLAAPTGAVVGDNVPMTLLYLNNACRIGSVVLPALATSTVVGASTAAVAQTTKGVNNELPLPFVCAVGDSNIYYRLETLTVFTPASGQKFYLKVTAENN